jgi:hypothetical protein
MLLLRLLHAFRKQRFELVSDLLRFAFEFVEELALLVVDFAIVETHPPQPCGFFRVDPAVRQDVVFNSLVEELLESRRAVLDPLVQFHEEVRLSTFDLAASVDLTSQRLQLWAIDPSVRQNGLFDFP